MFYEYAAKIGEQIEEEQERLVQMELIDEEYTHAWFTTDENNFSIIEQVTCPNI